MKPNPLQFNGLGFTLKHGRWVLRLGLSLVLGATLAGCAHRGQESATLEYNRQYHYPLLSPGTQFASLPPAVQRTVRAETGSADIFDIKKDTSGGRLVYIVYFENRESQPPLYIAPDGTVLDKDLKVMVGAPRETTASGAGSGNSITLNDLPPKAVKTIQQTAPDAEVARISHQTRGDQTIYVVTFKDHKHAPLYLSSEGTVLPDEP